MRNNKKKDTREKKFILTDNRNGITLIALVVTIVVLLILAGVSISLIMDNNGIIQKSKDARREYGQASENEQKELSGLSDLIEAAVGKIEYNEELKALKPGDYIIYDTGIEGVGEITCRVLYDAESPYNLQIITDDCIKKDGEYVYIPFGKINHVKHAKENVGWDQEVDEKFKDYDFSEWYQYNSEEKVYEEYNNAINILNHEAMKFYNNKYIVDARCVGSNPIDKSTETKEFAIIPDGVCKDSFRPQPGDVTNIKDEDDNYETDYNTLQSLNILTVNRNYWLASRYNEVGPAYSAYNTLLFFLDNDGSNFYSYTTDGAVIVTGYEVDNLIINALRPVFTLKGNLKVVSGDGASESTAYRLGV